MANYRKKKGKKARCLACGITFEYNRGRSAQEALDMHKRLNQICKQDYNQRAVERSTNGGSL